MSKQQRSQPSLRSRRLSGLIGGLLLVLCVGWLLWLLTQHQGPLKLSWDFSNPTSAAIDLRNVPLAAAGITLGTPPQPASLNQQQALLLANQLEPAAASQSKTRVASYVLLNYQSRTNPAPRGPIQGAPAWMILYQQIPLQPADAAVDPTPFPRSYHDLYVFLDASTGKELLVIWA